MRNRTAHRIARRIIADGGATIARDGTEPITGYAVALPGHELTYPLPSSQRELAALVLAYALEHSAELETDGAHLGAWIDGPLVYLDITRVIADRRKAELEGIAARQLAIFDLGAGEEIRLPAPGEVTR